MVLLVGGVARKTAGAWLTSGAHKSSREMGGPIYQEAFGCPASVGQQDREPRLDGAGLGGAYHKTRAPKVSACTPEHREPLSAQAQPNERIRSHTAHDVLLLVCPDSLSAHSTNIRKIKAFYVSSTLLNARNS